VVKGVGFMKGVGSNLREGLEGHHVQEKRGLAWRVPIGPCFNLIVGYLF
jgi:hypothetical protein